MTGINLRVATLKNAKLKNCNLRGATLAGTDLEVRGGMWAEIGKLLREQRSFPMSFPTIRLHKPVFLSIKTKVILLII